MNLRQVVDTTTKGLQETNSREDRNEPIQIQRALDFTQRLHDELLFTYNNWEDYEKMELAEHVEWLQKFSDYQDTFIAKQKEFIGWINKLEEINDKEAIQKTVDLASMYQDQYNRFKSNIDDRQKFIDELDEFKKEIEDHIKDFEDKIVNLKSRLDNQ